MNNITFQGILHDGLLGVNCSKKDAETFALNITEHIKNSTNWKNFSLSVDKEVDFPDFMGIKSPYTTTDWEPQFASYSYRMNNTKSDTYTYFCEKSNKYKELESNIFHAQLEISEIERKGKKNEVYYELKLQLNILQNQIYTKKDKIMTAALNIDLVAHRENKLDSTPVSACDVAREVAYRNGCSACEFGETPDAPWDFL